MYGSKVSSSREGPRFGRASWLAAAGLTLLANPLLAAAGQAPGDGERRERTAQRSSSNSARSQSSSGSSRSTSANRGSSSRGTSSRGTSGGSRGSSTRSRGTQSRSDGASRGTRAPRSREGFRSGQNYRSDQSRGDHSYRGRSREGTGSTRHYGSGGSRHGYHGGGTRHYRSYRHHHYGHRPYYHHYYPFSWGIGLGYYGGYGYSRYGYGYYGYCGPYRYPYYPYPTQYYEGKTLGGMDLNVKPKDAQVYLNGSPIGKVGKYDGYPRYLWLEEGKYEVIFYLEGYETIRRELNVIPGVVLDINHQMAPGASTDPEEISAIDPEEIRWVDENGQEVAEAKGDWWKKPPYLGRAGEPAPGAEDAPRPGADGSLDARREPGTVRLTVVPSNASVYLDGRFIGTGSQITELESGLLVDPGEHVIEVVHPSFERKELRFEVSSGDEVELKVGMKKKSSRRAGIEASL